MNSNKNEKNTNIDIIEKSIRQLLELVKNNEPIS